MKTVEKLRRTLFLQRHLDGHATVGRDRRKMEELFTPIIKTWFPEGLDDPHLTLIRFEAGRGNFWDSKAGMLQVLPTADISPFRIKALRSDPKQCPAKRSFESDGRPIRCVISSLRRSAWLPHGPAISLYQALLKPMTHQTTRAHDFQLNPADYRQVFYAFDQGFCVLEVLVDDEGTPQDYRFLEVNHVFEQQTGLTAPVGRTALELVPNLERYWIDAYGRVALTGEPVRFVQQSPAMGRWFDVHASRIGAPASRLVALLFNDITAHHLEQESRKRAEDGLRASEHRFRVFADTAPAMLWVTEADGACSYLSRGWYEFTGQTEAQGLGYGWLDAVHPAEREMASRTFLSANAKQEPFELQHRVRRPDGVYRWVLDAGRPRFDAAGKFEGYIGSVIDLHDLKLAEDRLDLAVNSGKVGLWYCDLPFDTLVWNAQVKEHFGLPSDANVTIDTFFERLHPDDRERTRNAIEASIERRTTYDTQYRTIGLDGRTRWIRAVGRAAFEDDRPVRFDGITIDISELVSLQQAAEAASRAKDEFLAMLGHELRNPLAPILTALQLLKLRGVSGVERERTIIERQVSHLVGLVDDLLDVSRITRGRIELRKEPLDLADIVAHAVEIASPLLEQQRHRLEVDVPRGLWVKGDSGRLSQVVANLLTNAAKYTESGGANLSAWKSGGRRRHAEGTRHWRGHR